MEANWIATVERVLQFTATYGIAVVFLSVFLLGVSWVFYELIALLRTWAPKVASGHVDLLSSLKDSTEVQTEASLRTAHALETLCNTRTEQDAKTHRVLRHFAIAAKETTTAATAQHHIDEALHELEDKK